MKMEPLDEDQLDFAFATEVLSGWKPNEESDVALWKRMETMVRSPTFGSLRSLGQLKHVLSDPVPLPRLGRHSVKNIGPGLNTSLRAALPRREDNLVFSESHFSRSLVTALLAWTCNHLLMHWLRKGAG